MKINAHKINPSFRGGEYKRVLSLSLLSSTQNHFRFSPSNCSSLSWCLLTVKFERLISASLSNSNKSPCAFNHQIVPQSVGVCQGVNKKTRSLFKSNKKLFVFTCCCLTFGKCSGMGQEWLLSRNFRVQFCQQLCSPCNSRSSGNSSDRLLVHFLMTNN